jgi:Family of unknown function (DUF5906)
MPQGRLPDTGEQGSVNAILDGLRFRYRGVPEGSQFSVDWIAEDNVYHTTLYPCSEAAYRKVADYFAGRRTWHVFSRIAVLSPTFVQETPGARGGDKDTWGTSTIQLDLDPPHDMEVSDYSGWREYKLEELRNFQPVPTRVEASGRGLHALWKVEWIDDWRYIKRIQKSLTYALGGDDTFDTARVLRLTGTYNNKLGTPVQTFVVWDNDVRYTAWDLPATDLDREDERLEASQVAIEQLTEQDITWLQDSDLWPRIESEETAKDAGAHTRHGDAGLVSRHRNDIFVAVRLLQRGWPQEKVAAVLTHPEWFSGDKFRTPPNSYNPRYVWQTLSTAQAYVDKGTTQIVEMGKRIAEGADGTHFRSYARQLFVYTNGGVYEPGEDDLNLAVQAYAGDKWRPDMIYGVRTFIMPHVAAGHSPEIPGWINTTSGFVEWNAPSPVLHRHAPAYFSISQVDARWNPNVRTDAVDKLVARLLYPEDIPVWWMWSGYCLSTETPVPFHKMLAIVGPPRTGKSTLLRTLVEFLGPRNCSGVPLTELTGGGGQFTTSFLWGNLLNVDGDADYTQQAKNVSLLKRVSGGDMVKVERKGEQSTDEYLFTKLAFAMNQYPRIGSTDEAFFNRWLVLRVREDVRALTDDNPATVQNMHRVVLSSGTNRDAWLVRSIQGLKQLHANGGFPKTQSGQTGMKEMRGAGNPVYRWWVEETVVSDTKWHPIGDYFEPFQMWQRAEEMEAIVRRHFVTGTQELVRGGTLEGLDLRFNTKADTYEVRGRKPKGIR